MKVEWIMETRPPHEKCIENIEEPFQSDEKPSVHLSPRAGNDHERHLTK